MPFCYRRHYGLRVVSIIDCFELFIEKPSNLLAKACTWSTYKHYNTAKYLISVTPQGSISLISKGWGGRTSDKYITEHSGYLSNLLPGDIILADRGFDVADSVATMGASLELYQHLLKGVSSEIENKRKMANVRIHVERAIGAVRQKFTILSATGVITKELVQTKSSTGVDFRRSRSRCVDLRRSMCRLSKIDVSTFGDGCVDLRRPMIDVSTFEDR